MGITFNLGQLTALEKLKKARIKIQQKNTFFGYMSLYLKFQEIDDNFMEMPCGVDAEGNFYYKKKFIEDLKDEQVEGLEIHEIMHLVLMHLSRRRNRHPEGWNIAADIVVNSIAIKNNYQLPDGGLVPTGYDEIKVLGVTVKDISTKTAEMIYDELPIRKGRGPGPGPGPYPGPKGGKKKNPGSGDGGWDQHIEAPKGETEKQKKEREEKWLQRIEDAVAKSLSKGDIPAGMTSMVKKLHKSQVHWKTLLQRYIQSYIPFDYTFQKPNKKSVSSGFYLPGYLKEKIQVLVGVDMSGSIGEKEVADFMSEIVGLARAYQDRVKIILLTHDVDVHDEYVVENGVAEKLLKLKLHGGGGTSHQPIFEKIQKKYAKDTKVAIFLTDGCSDLQNIKIDKYSFDKIFVISKGGIKDLSLKGRHKMIYLDD